ncbi:ATP-binding cassette domain-containing protein [Candidatus Lucifugimonas marina]|uniref:ATP-binding cassette domain-containing protein n=1 Tax=Candidatus Lucifugimonas marina TaxID=3038979 RepID=A0AAJ6CTA4_9CHLR|nr:ATP-binding cassette domain-containing protein [SAR202 cluster bacterium JH702]MDG0868727.1 ATP-binding cassette domain-containing protein [SAR202 cluster bacterium JH639]WFG35359.1 ATP-binding cassette domain-containing protein [SAR202 cluster bacterium JH545]WFG39307.1 ATP-binding cassette domain-containing protein [SAR202 cluster bacterium JH1073]
MQKVTRMPSEEHRAPLNFSNSVDTESQNVAGHYGKNFAPDEIPIRFDETWFSYNSDPVVRDINFSITPGEFAAILGPNGSGKTTLMKLALGLLKPTSGQVLLFGEPADSFTDWHRVGYVPQRTQATESRFPASVREIVNFGSYTGFNPLAIFNRKSSSRVDEAMELAGIQHLADRRVSDLSVGQQQRMLIARSLVRQPDLLVMDEPVAGVDAAGEEQFHSMVRRLNRDLGITIVMVSHDIGAVMREATTCACVNGDIVFHGPVHQLDAQALSGLYGFPVDVLMHDPEHTHR